MLSGGGGGGLDGPQQYSETLSEHAVVCTRHVYDAHVVLQFAVTNNGAGPPPLRMQNVTVHVEPLGDNDLYVPESEVRAAAAAAPARRASRERQTSERERRALRAPSSH